MPAEAEGTSAKSAKAFARYYVGLVSYGIQSGDTRVLAEASAQDCTSCKAISQNIRDVYSSGGRIESKGWTLRSSRVIQNAKMRAVLSLDLRLSSQMVVSRDGKRDRHSGGKQLMTMYLSRMADSYQVSRLDLVS